MTSRGDSQNHAAYARRMCGWTLAEADAEASLDPDRFFDAQRPRGDYMHVFRYQGQRVTRRDLDFDAWHDWQAELSRRLTAAIAFFYGNLRPASAAR